MRNKYKGYSKLENNIFNIIEQITPMGVVLLAVLNLLGLITLLTYLG